MPTRDDDFRKKHGLPKREPLRWAVPPLPPPPEGVRKVVEEYQNAWQAWDAAMIASDGDRPIADLVFDRALKSKRKQK